VGSAGLNKFQTCIMIPGVFGCQALAETFGELLPCFSHSIAAVVQKDLSDGLWVSELFLVVDVQNERFWVVYFLEVHDCWVEALAFLEVLE
jgi:hypothetical protein